MIRTLRESRLAINENANSSFRRTLRLKTGRQSGIRGRTLPRQILTALIGFGLVGVWVSPISAVAAQEHLIVSVADPGIQSFDGSGLTADAPVLVETFENTQFGGNWVCSTPVQDEYGNPMYDEWWNPLCGDGDGDGYEDSGVENPHTLFSIDTQSFESPVGVFTREPWNGDIYWADRWGGAGGEGQYVGAGNILLTVSDQSDYRYLGFWWSAGSVGNDVQLLDENGELLASFTVDTPGTNEDLEGVTSDAAYLHNPNQNIGGWQTYEKYAFVHLRYPPGFRKVRFVSQGNGFEFDNVTISTEVPDFADSETTTETFNPYEISTPGVLLADPRASEVLFPGLSLIAGAGEENAMICISQVENSNGDDLTLPSIPTMQSNGTVTAGITSSTETNLQTFSGTRSIIEAFSTGIFLSPIVIGEAFNTLGSRFFRITVTPQTNAGSAGCTGNAADSVIVEIRFVNMIQRNSFEIRIG